MAYPLPDETRLTGVLDNEAATAVLARRLATQARRGDVLALRGDLGAGKSSFARAFIGALALPSGAAAGEEVPSPTFTLVQVYDRAPASVWHFDLYRLEDPEEAYELGIEEALAEGILLIEWPDRLGPLLPADRLEVALAFGATHDARVVDLRGGPSWQDRLAGLDLTSFSERALHER